MSSPADTPERVDAPAEQTAIEAVAPEATPTVPAVSSYTRITARAQSKFFSTLLLASLGVLCYYGYAAQTPDVLHLYEGELILMLSMLPALLWAKDPGRSFPTFEGYLFTFGNAFGDLSHRHIHRRTAQTAQEQ